MSAATPALQVDGLGVRYGALVALDAVSWAVHPGELLGIIGPNGAGKSTCYEATTALVARSDRLPSRWSPVFLVLIDSFNSR